MGYSNILLVQAIIAQALTTGSPMALDEPVDLLQIGNTFDTNRISTSTIDQYIAWADEEIDAALSQMYLTPLKEMVDFETGIEANIDEYNEYAILDRKSPIHVADEFILTDGVNEERHVVESVQYGDNGNTIVTTVTNIGFSFLASNTRFLRVKYPNPIAQMSARLAAANMYDKYFASQTSPNESKFGQFLRAKVRQDVDNILNGRSILHGQSRIGRRFVNPYLIEDYKLPGESGDKNIDDLGRG